MNGYDIRTPSGRLVDAAKAGRHAADTLETSDPTPGYVGRHRQPEPAARAS